MLRDIRSAPFAWQHLDAYGALLARYEGQSRATAIGVYCTLTYLASRQHTPSETRAFVATISETVGLGRSTVRKYLAEFEEMGIVQIERTMIGERMSDANRYLLVTPPPADEKGGSVGRRPPPPADEKGVPASGRQPQEQLIDEENHQQAAVAAADDDPLIEELIREGIDPRTAVVLLDSAGPELVDGWLGAESWRSGRNPVGVLISHLRRGDPPPPPPESQWERYRRERGDQRGAD